MSADTLQRIDEKGWRRGFANLLDKENGIWWKTSQWWKQIVIWLLILNGILALMLWAVPTTPAGEADSAGMSEEERQALEQLQEPTYEQGGLVFVIISGMATAVGVVIIMQEAIIDERNSGTLAWVLSNPVSRTAFILSKLVANGIGVLVTMIVAQGAVAYVQLSLSRGEAMPVLPFVGAMALLGLNALFYLTLTLMLSIVPGSRGAAIGIPMALIFGYQLVTGAAPWLMEIMPWGLIAPLPGSISPLAASLILDEPVTSIVPVVATALWCVLFVGIAIWRFNQEEF